MAEITTTQSFADGDTVTAAKLNNIIANASVGADLITNRSELLTIEGTADLVLVYDESASGLRKVKANNLVQDSSITTTKIADSSVANAKIADSAITTAKISDNSVTTAKISDNSVTTAKIADNSITTVKIAAGAVITDDLADSSVTTAKIADNSITSSKIADGSISTADIADSAITNSKLANPQYTGFRNRIINGGMRIDQRNAGASVTISNVFHTDRWQAYEDSDGVMTAQQDSSAPSGFTNSLKITTTTADSSLSSLQYACLLQSVEGYNVSDFAFGTASAKTITISFWVRSSLTGTFGGVVKNAGAGTRSYPFTYSISNANTWENKAVTITGDTTGTWASDNSCGMQIVFGLGVGSTYSGTAGAWAGSNLLSATGAVSVLGTLNATWYITGVQLEVGTTATDFERRPIGTELALCQRYYEKSFPINYAPAVNFNETGFAALQASQSGINGTTITVPFAARKRSSPTVITYANAISGSGRYHIATSADYTDGAVTSGESSFYLQMPSSGGQNFKMFHWTADSEL